MSPRARASSATDRMALASSSVLSIIRFDSPCPGSSLSALSSYGASNSIPASVSCLWMLTYMGSSPLPSIRSSSSPALMRIEEMGDTLDLDVGETGTNWALFHLRLGSRNDPVELHLNWLGTHVSLSE